MSEPSNPWIQSTPEACGGSWADMHNAARVREAFRDQREASELKTARCVNTRADHIVGNNTTSQVILKDTHGFVQPPPWWKRLLRRIW